MLAADAVPAVDAALAVDALRAVFRLVVRSLWLVISAL
ncbi:hypothetical protein STRTUCAR8_07006 [Streptomyces turgidiscabies Car8]|uniref:Uncharacterized protein n=1 Tax=Streptomyces turgidiscabies (strain Car8) TaxID=698760 RepID=L7FH03_STRT8|nr:hypothetical protein STRTUCAR8_07006 [Streptomyces turgidiscabies Car8]